MPTVLEMLQKHLTPEVYSQVSETLSQIDEFGEDVVPITRLNAVIGERQNFKKQLKDLNAQYTTLSEALDGAPDLTTALANKDAEWQKKFDALTHGAAIKDLVAKASPKDVDVVMDLLKLEDADYAEEYKGAKAKLTELQKQKAFLFGEGSSGTGRHDSGTGLPGGKTFGELTDIERIDLNKSNPDLFKSAQQAYLQSTRKVL
jgi:electron transfer flavoprotein alpha subunit